MKKIETYLPVFTGFYGTIFEADETNEIDDINQQRTAKNLPEINYDDCKFNYKEYHNDVSKKACDYIEQELKSLGIVHKIEFETLVSLREYNFANDSINVVILLTDDNIKEIKKFLNDNIDSFKEYLKDKYTSCSGFISYHPNSFEGWYDITKGFTEYSENAHYLGSVLNFICAVNEITDSSMHDSLIDISIYAENYDELINGKLNFHHELDLFAKKYNIKEMQFTIENEDDEKYYYSNLNENEYQFGTDGNIPTNYICVHKTVK